VAVKRGWLGVVLLLSLGMNVGIVAMLAMHRLRDRPLPNAELPVAGPMVPADLAERMADRLRLEGDDWTRFVTIQKSFLDPAVSGRRELEKLRHELRREMTSASPDRSRVLALVERSNTLQLDLERAFVTCVLDTRDLLGPREERAYVAMLGRLRAMVVGGGPPRGPGGGRGLGPAGLGSPGGGAGEVEGWDLGPPLGGDAADLGEGGVSPGDGPGPAREADLGAVGGGSGEAWGPGGGRGPGEVRGERPPRVPERRGPPWQDLRASPSAGGAASADAAWLEQLQARREARRERLEAARGRPPQGPFVAPRDGAAGGRPGFGTPPRPGRPGMGPGPSAGPWPATSPPPPALAPPAAAPTGEPVPAPEAGSAPGTEPETAPGTAPTSAPAAEPAAEPATDPEPPAAATAPLRR
jgi:hypothetical protein